MAGKNLKPTARVVSDGPGCWRTTTRPGWTHEPILATKTG
jgi:hypothetical protein